MGFLTCSSTASSSTSSAQEHSFLQKQTLDDSFKSSCECCSSPVVLSFHSCPGWRATRNISFYFYDSPQSPKKAHLCYIDSGRAFTLNKIIKYSEHCLSRCQRQWTWLKTALRLESQCKTLSRIWSTSSRVLNSTSWEHKVDIHKTWSGYRYTRECNCRLVSTMFKSIVCLPILANKRHNMFDHHHHFCVVLHCGYS